MLNSLHILSTSDESISRCLGTGAVCRLFVFT